MATTTWNSDLDLLLNELRNAVIQSLTTNPTGTPGRVYYNSADGTLRWYDGVGDTWRSTGEGYTDEQVRDVVGALLVGGTGVNISVDDPNDTITISVSGLGIANISGLQSALEGKSDVGHTHVAADITDFTTAARGAISVSDTPTLDLSYSGGTISGAVLDSPTVGGSSPVQLRDRSTHTGTQLANTISNFDVQVRTSRLDQMAVPTAAVAMGSQRITGLANGTETTDAINLGQLESAIEGRKWKDPVRVATTENITLSGTQTIDGVAVVAGDRVLVKDQTSAAANGIYVVATGAWTRAADANTAPEVTQASVMVSLGAAYTGTVWTQTATIATIGTTAQTWVQTGSPGSTYTAGTGLELVGNAFRIATTAAGAGLTGGGGSALAVAVDDSSIEISSNSLRVKDGGITDAMLATAPLKRHDATWTGAGTSLTVTHNIGRRFVHVSVYDGAGVLLHGIQVTATSTTQCTLDVNSAPGAATWSVVVVG